MAKIVVSDLDGTLLNEQHRISKITAEAVDKLRKSGTKFVVATGRHRCDIHLMLDALGGNIFTITSNGARVHYPNGELFFSENICADIVHDIISIGRQYRVHQNVYSGNQWLVEKPNEALLALHAMSDFAYEKMDLLGIDASNIAKIFFVGNRTVLHKLNAVLEARYGTKINLTFSLENTLEVMASGVSKGRALQLVLDHKSLATHEAMVFGDGMNDLEMLQLVGYPVLMENAHEDLKNSIENYQVAPSNKHDGVAQFIMHYFA